LTARQKLFCVLLAVSVVLLTPYLWQGRSLAVPGTGSLKGTIRAAESGLPLASGQIQVENKKVPIKGGRFTIPELPTGRHQLIIKGPYRQTKKTTIEIRPGENQADISVPCIFAEDEISLLARITRAEAEGESLQGQTAVAASILNRVNSPRYPSTIRDIVYQRVNGRYQYSPVRDGRIKLPPTEASYKAAFQALTGQDPSHGATGFFNPGKTRDRWVHSQPVTTRIDGHVFFRY
jgi:hypothetical protein